MISNFISQFWMEISAVLFAIIYLLLAVKQDVKCWFAAIISSLLYFFINTSTQSKASRVQVEQVKRRQCNSHPLPELIRHFLGSWGIPMLSVC